MFVKVGTSGLVLDVHLALRRALHGRCSTRGEARTLLRLGRVEFFQVEVAKVARGAIRPGSRSINAVLFVHMNSCSSSEFPSQ